MNVLMGILYYMMKNHRNYGRHKVGNRFILINL